MDTNRYLRQTTKLRKYRVELFIRLYGPFHKDVRILRVDGNVAEPSDLAVAYTIGSDSRRGLTGGDNFIKRYRDNSTCINQYMEYLSKEKLICTLLEDKQDGSMTATVETRDIDFSAVSLSPLPTPLPVNKQALMQFTEAVFKEFYNMARKQDLLADILNDNALELEITFDGTTGAARWEGRIVFEDEDGEEVTIEADTARLDSLVASLVEQLENKGFPS